MKRCALFVGCIALFAAPAPAFALREVILGNRPLPPGFGGLDKEALAALNVEERVYLSNHEGTLDVYFKGDPKALNDALRRFAAIPADSGAQAAGRSGIESFRRSQCVASSCSA
jgi:hypothetical protein